MNIKNINTDNKKVAIIGGGWYGCHISLYLKKHNLDVTIYEKESKLFKGVSNYYGIRIHAGPHYPISNLTRKNCIDGLSKFLIEYPELIVYHENSFYGLGKEDVDGLLPRIKLEEFKKVCQENPFFNQEIYNTEFTNLQILYNVFEPSLKIEIIGEYFENKLKENNINIFFNHEIKSIKNNKINNNEYNWIINCTYFKDLIPKVIPLDIEIFYQSCLTLYYKDKEINNKPFSFTVMDGWFPCIMPYENSWKNPENRIYVLYHAKYTILGSFKTIDESKEIINKLSDNYIINNIVPLFEKDILRYYPNFKKRFEYFGYNTAISTKIKSQSEFRSSIVFSENNIIHVFSGKVNNIFNAADKVLDIIKNNKNDNFNDLKKELMNSVNNNIITTCDLQTFKDLNI